MTKNHLMNRAGTSIKERAGKIRTLIVDDCVELAAKLRELLDTMPELETVGVAGDGEEALEMTQRLQPELVIMDIQMPVMNGIEAARTMEALCPRPRVVLTSAIYQSESYVHSCLQGVEFIAKARLWKGLPEVIQKMRGENT